MCAETISPPADVRQIAAGRHEPSRIRLAATASTPAELLFFMANDHSPAVRAAVALNDATPPQADRCLTRDADPRVRMVLARKLARIAPALSLAQQDRLAGLAWENLECLAADAAFEVRGLVAELVCELPEAPRSLILHLARDPAFSVSDPILRLSPQLTDDDLLGILALAPAAHTAGSIARRAALGPAVCDAIARDAGTEAVRTLLANGSARIREATLDGLVARAAAEQEWHPSLVQRPVLSAAQARTLSGFVADHLLDILAARPELDPALVADLRRALAARLPCATANGQGADPSADPAATEQALIAAIRAGRQDAVIELLAGRARVAVQAVRHVAQLRSAKGMVSLVWKAGLPMRLAVPVQSLLCSLGPANTIRPGPEGAFPLSEEEMRWQIDFIGQGLA